MYFIITLPALLLAMYAQWRVQSAYRTWGEIPNQRRVSGLDAARALLSLNGLQHVQVEGTPGSLSDHYDPRTKTLRLSQDVAYGTSVASVAIVAHEVGHAVQDAEGYAPMRFRGALVPAVQLGSSLGPILFMIGFGLSVYTGSELGFTIAQIGLVLFSLAALFALATLPVEFNASARAKQMIAQGVLVGGQDDLRGTHAVLNAAALTYVAGLAQALAQLLYFALLLSGARRRD
jgi:Zn-dependent membrane protease YugP